MEWKNWSSHPVIVGVGIIIAVITLVNTLYKDHVKHDSPSPSPSPSTSIQPPVKEIVSQSSPTVSQSESPQPIPSPSSESETQTPEPKILSPKHLKLDMCVRNESQGSSISTYQSGDISIGREVITQSFNMGYIFTNESAVASIVCKIPDGYKSLHLNFGRKDGDETHYMDGHGTSMIRIYLNSKLTKTVPVMSGEKKKLDLDISKTKNLAIEFQCRSSSGCGTVYFFDTDFE
jgi:hypothetical protein